MLVTTNNSTKETEVLEVLPADALQSSLTELSYRFTVMTEIDIRILSEKRIEVESRGNPDEYDALAREYAAAGFFANADTLTSKAAGMRIARMR